jgi:dTDP-4-amino-4,6-dideoxygalactose transaminase
VELLKEKIARVKAERDEILAQYDEEIGECEAELRSLGVAMATDSHPNEVAVLTYNYLKANPGRMVSGGELMRAIKREGAIASIVLRPLIESRKVKRVGERRGTVYTVESSASEVE